MTTILKKSDNILSHDLVNEGYTITEDSDDFVILRYKGLPVDIFTQHTTANALNLRAYKHQEEII